MNKGSDAELIVRLNARIHNQREQIKHERHTLIEVGARTNRLLDLLGANPAQPLLLRLDEAVAALTKVEDGETK